MKKGWMYVVFFVLGGVLGVFTMFANAGDYTGSDKAAYKNEIIKDRQAIKDQAAEIKQDSSTAKQEEAALKESIRAAEQAGDKATAESLKAQLRSTHQANVQGRAQDKSDMHAARNELKNDVKAARAAGAVPPRGRGPRR
jgi:hypothetical protein